MDRTPPDRMTFDAFKLGCFNLFKDQMRTAPPSPEEGLGTDANCEAALRELYELSPPRPGHFEADPEACPGLGLASEADVEAMVRFLTGEHFAADEAAFRDAYAKHRGVVVYNGRVQATKPRGEPRERRRH